MSVRIPTTLCVALLAALPNASAQLRSTPAFGRDTITLTFTAESITQFRTVNNAPYSGIQTTERVQTLANGTHLTQSGQMDTSLWRDSLGRLRTERPIIGATPKSIPATTIQLDDPVAGFTWLLDSAAKIAHRIPLKSRPAVVRPANLPQGPATTNTLANGVIAENVPLGNRIIDGVETMGMRMTMTYPPGSRMGNDKPVAIVSESWISPQLATTLISKNSDPATGDFTTTLKNLKLTEPDPELFRIPLDYKVVEETGPFSITIPR